MGNPRTKLTGFNDKFQTVIIEWGLSEEIIQLYLGSKREYVSQETEGGIKCNGRNQDGDGDLES